jgi:membrane fusion protein (multidrug efflux system)
MSVAFSRTLRSLEADGFRRTSWGLLLAAALMAAWAAWFLFGAVTRYEVSETARLEADRAAHPVQAPVTGRIATTHLTLGREVQAGEVLVELEPDIQQHQVEEARSRLAALDPQIEALRQEVAAEKRALSQSRQASRAALEGARAQFREAEALARLAEQESERSARLHAGGLLPEAELLRAKAEAERRRAAADGLRLALDRLPKEEQARESERQGRIEALHREITRLDGERAAATAALQRVEHERERRRIRAPVAGRIGGVAERRVGEFVDEGDELAAIVPGGTLRIVAYFIPAAALGRIQPGQRARLRLEGFPWAQYGSIAATVSSVASELQNARVRVELAVQASPNSPIPLQHGLPGEVEVEVERVSPVTLALRVAGRLVAGSGPPSGSREGPGGGR